MFKPSLLAKWADREMEKNVLTKADTIITVGQTLAAILGSKGEKISQKIHILPNGYDEEDFEGILPITPDKFTITYVGSLSPAYPVNGLIEAVKGLRVNDKPVSLKFVGTVPEPIQELFPADEEGNRPDFIQYCEHPEAIRYMMESTMLLLIIPDHLSNKSILTGKIFEYLATGKPVLLLGPADGDAAQLMVKCGYQGIFDYNDVQGIRSFIRKVAEGRQVTRSGHHLEYSRRALAVKLGDLLNSLL
jgi:glycosyltransferase involved in cell wall biosynthesis